MAIKRPDRIVFICVAVAIALPLAARLIVGPPGALVHVRWATPIDAATRVQLEREFSLEAGAQQDEGTWRYDLRDTSTSHIRRIVTDSRVADTHHFDRERFVVSEDAERTGRPERFPVATATLLRSIDASAVVLVATAFFLFRRSRASAAGTRADHTVPRLGAIAQATGEAVGRVLAPWVPALDGRALGAYRLVLGCGLVWVALTRELTALPIEQQRHRALIDLDLVHQLAASESACSFIEMAMLAAAVLFAAGILARASYAAFVVAFAVSVLITLERTSAHDLGLPLVTFLGWLTVPWSAKRDMTLQRANGFAIWWPGLTVGLALLAAAYWKLHQSGIEWITGGAVKYHFIADSANAHVDWGLRVAANHELAVVLSLGAILAEALFIGNVFVRGPWARLVAGLGGAGLFVLLYLFQGIFWPAWHVLFLAFLPWQLLNGGAPATDAVPSRALQLRTAQGFVVVILIVVQTFASAAGKEAEPLMSHFPMYAHNYASTEDFETSLRPRLTRVLEARADGADILSEWTNLVDNDRFLLMDLAEQPAVRIADLSERERRDRELLCTRYPDVFGGLPEEVTFSVERRGFDWNSGRFTDYIQVRTSPVALADICHQLAAAGSTR